MITHEQAQEFFNSHKESAYFQNVLSAFSSYIEEVITVYVNEDEGRSLSALLLDWTELQGGRIFYNDTHRLLAPYQESITTALTTDPTEQDASLAEMKDYFRNLLTNHMQVFSPTALEDSHKLIKDPIRNIYSFWVDGLGLDDKAKNCLHTAISYKIWVTMADHLQKCEGIEILKVSKVFNTCVNIPSEQLLKNAILNNHLRSRHTDGFDKKIFLNFIRNETQGLFDKTETKAIIDEQSSNSSYGLKKHSLSTLFNNKSVSFQPGVVSRRNKPKEKTPHNLTFTNHTVSNTRSGLGQPH